MSTIVTRPNKAPLILKSPVMPAAGTFGYGELYRDVVNLKKLGAIVTNPVTYRPRQPAKGQKVVPLDGGVLVHTGLPNPGIVKVVRANRDKWRVLDVPIVLHLVATGPDDIRRSMTAIEEVEEIRAVELGLPDDIPWQEAATLTQVAVRSSEKPVLVRLPMYSAYEIAEGVADAGAGALVVCAPPRGTARDPRTGQQVSGRVYGPMIKALALQQVQQLVKRLPDVPIIGAGGIHSQQDARDYIFAGARAVQVDSVTWVLPRMIEIIARDLSGLVLTRESGALGDEWFTGMGETAAEQPELYDDERN